MLIDLRIHRVPVDLCGPSGLACQLAESRSAGEKICLLQCMAEWDADETALEAPLVPSANVWNIRRWEGQGHVLQKHL